MQKPIINAEYRLLQLITALEGQKQYINTREFIGILEKTKCIYRNNDLLEAVINSIKILLSTPLKHRNTLTKRETEIILLIGQGLRNNDIAVALELRLSTIETHRKNIRKKLKLKGKDPLIVFALIHSLQYHNLC